MRIDPWALIVAVAVVTAAIKAAGPVALGGRALPPPAAGVLALLAPALLAALVVTGVASRDGEWHLGTEAAGVAAGGLVAWRGGTILVAVVVAAGTTAGLRALT
ncbi:AzlD domain-containing protein [Patulibacter brassicae]|jgi:branched-subunit amino acid transport protein|uniref:AzlD domain-containing protein n=1 Tax=Patulibacter brassicae TaxID=1705717 RepID=A0ABU4VMI7_9ACTN|nr:AzlD domain-containing protein [Patulibacter brassicae]MDX8152299.1 AzlD domain-containing protein [Patulibacter brassicae]